MNKLITLLVLAAVICSAYAGGNFTNLYVASATSSPALVNCYNASTGIGLNLVYVKQFETAPFPDLVGLTASNLPVLSIYSGQFGKQTVWPAASLALLRLKIPQWGGKVGC